MLDIDFTLKPSELKEVLRVDNLRRGASYLADLKFLENDTERLVLLKTNTGNMYLVDFTKGKNVYHLNEAAFGRAGLLSSQEVFPTKEIHLIIQPLLNTREYIQQGIPFYNNG